MSPKITDLAKHDEEIREYGCFIKAKANGEPTFTLRAQDRTAALVVQMWADLNEHALGKDHPKIVEARAIAEKMRAWPRHKQAD